MAVARLIALGTQIFPYELMVRPDHVSVVELMFDGDNGIYLRIHMTGGYIFPSYRFDGGDAAVVAKLRAARDGVVDSIRVALAEDQPAIQPASQEKRSL